MRVPGRSFMCVLLWLIVGLLGPSWASAQEVMTWRLARIYWESTAPNPTVRIAGYAADSRGGWIELEHFPFQPDCREAAIKARYEWRFDRDISLLSGRRGELAFISQAVSDADQGKGCWAYNSLIGWEPGWTNDFATCQRFPDRGTSGSLNLEGRRTMRVEVRLDKYVRDDYRGVFRISFGGQGVPGGWDHKAIYEFEQRVGAPVTTREATCDQYAKVAVEQQTENLRRRCGYSGVAWQANYGAHYGWCMGVSSDVADRERRARTEALQRCSGERAFTNPTVGGYRVDRCLTWGAQCDKPAADRFCQDRGFSGAASWRWEYGGPTIVLGTGQICPGDRCGAFTYIECLAIQR